jgi:hypothetical protein
VISYPQKKPLSGITPIAAMSNQQADNDDVNESLRVNLAKLESHFMSNTTNGSTEAETSLGIESAKEAR